MAALEFTGDWDPDLTTRFPCVGFGRDWNGFATPVVIRPTLTALIEDAGMDWSISYDASGIATLTPRNEPGDAYTITPDSFGLYHLSVMGWTFYDVRDIDPDGPGPVRHDGTIILTTDEIRHAMAVSTGTDEL